MRESVSSRSGASTPRLSVASTGRTKSLSNGIAKKSSLASLHGSTGSLVGSQTEESALGVFGITAGELDEVDFGMVVEEEELFLFANV